MSRRTERAWTFVQQCGQPQVWIVELLGNGPLTTAFSILAHNQLAMVRRCPGASGGRRGGDVYGDNAKTDREAFSSDFKHFKGLNGH